MARQLWLLRHADAEPHGTRPDPQRYLTERGKRQARVAGLALARMGVGFEAVLSSPKERALRSAALALAAWGERSRETRPQCELKVHPPLEGGFDAQQALAATAQLSPDARLLAVGHEPDLSGVVEDLTGARIDLKKAGLAVLRLSSAPAAGDPSGPSAAVGGELLLLLRPAELALIADVAPAET